MSSSDEETKQVKADLEDEEDVQVFNYDKSAKKKKKKQKGKKKDGKAKVEEAAASGKDGKNAEGKRHNSKITC